jgi:putative transposase
VSAADLALMRRIDELHLEFPFAGSRPLRDLLAAGYGFSRGTARPVPWYRRSSGLR